MSNFCQNCGTQLTDEDVFCPKCGAKTNRQTQQTQQTPPSAMSVPPKKKKTGLIIGIAAGAVAIAVVLVLLLTGVFGSAQDISDIQGRWYGENDTLTFSEGGSILVVTDTEEINAKFSYDSQTGEGKIRQISGDKSEVLFVYQGETIVLQGKTYYRSKDAVMASAATPAPTVAPTPETTPEPTPDTEMLRKQIVGYWQLTVVSAEGESEDMTPYGMAFEFGADSSSSVFENYQETDAGSWAAVGSDSVDLSNSYGEIVTFTSITFAADGTSFVAEVTLEGVVGTMTFVKTDEQTFLASAAPDYSAVLGVWYDSVARALMIRFHEDGNATLTNQFGDIGGTYTFDPATGSGYVAFDTSDPYAFDFTIAGETMMGSEDIWVRTLPPFPAKPPVPAQDTTYTSDSDITALLVGIDWTYVFYQMADGTESYDVPEYTAKYYDTGKFDEVYDGESFDGIWHVENGIIHLHYSDEDYYIWPVSIQYRTDMQSYVLYMEKIDENNNGIGEYLVFTDYQP